jgi:glycosyltransferase involved in cell wall biosynthesis
LVSGAAKKVFVISNDIVPGLGMPVAAPGLRAFGLAEGLRANGAAVKTLVVKGFVERQWMRFGRSVPYPKAPDTEVIGAGRLVPYLRSHAPATVVIINSNQVDNLRPIRGIKYVMDFFAPKMLEMLYHHSGEYPKEEISQLRQRKIRAIRLADAFIVNGAKKVPYFLAWMLQADRDIRDLPIEVVNMCAPLAWGGPVVSGRDSDGPIRFAVAGYLHSWSTLGSWVKVVERHLNRPEVNLDLMVPWHWSSREYEHKSRSDLDRLASYKSVATHGPMTFSDFQRFLSTIDVAIDLFQHNLEREYAMVTRSIIALACGVPVLHPPFTEVSPMIAEYDAGWLVDPEDPETLEAAICKIIEDPAEVRQKKKNARVLASAVIDPAVAVEPLVRIMEAW